MSNWNVSRDEGQIVWLGLDRQGASTNTLDLNTLDELEILLDDYEKDKTLAGLVIYSLKENGFIAGADIEQFSQVETTAQARSLIEKGQGIFNQLAALKCPTVAMIHGFCLGGGLELALACRYRIAREDESTKIGFPEIKLGIYPSWTGSVRLPRLIGASRAMDLMLSGRNVSARSAKKMGLIHEAVPERQLKRAARYYILERPKSKRLAPWVYWTNASLFRSIIAKILRAKVSKKVRKSHYPAPYALIETWRSNGVEGMKAFKAEADTVVQLAQTPTAKNLARVFFLQDRLKKSTKKIYSQPEHVHVIGAGAMGGDIAAWCALQGFRVSLQDRDPQLIAPAIARAHQLATRKLKQDRLVRDMMDRLRPDPTGQGLAQADVIIEAIIERAEDKQTLFKLIEEKARPDAILATNTSTIPLSEIGALLKNPGRLIGLHFFNPVSQLPLVEVIYGDNTPDLLIRRGSSFIRAIDRLPLPVKSSPGFLVNRILMPYLMEALYLYDSGIPIETIDRAALAFGMPMGPVQLADAVGLDVCLLAAEKLVQHYGGVVPETLRRKVEQGTLGRKTNQGFYVYKNGTLVKPKTGATGDLTLITQRLTLSMLNEAMACWREGLVEDADLIDAGMIFGAGFPPFRGGPIHYARSIDKEKTIEQLERWKNEIGERFKPDRGWEML